jgi:DNA-binding CsgD family transcriptional regulator
LVRRAVDGDDGPALAISDLVSARALRKLEFHKIVFEPNGLNDQIALTLGTRRNLVVGISINRARRGFSTRDRALLELLRPHLSRAYAHALERERAAALRVLFDRGLEQSGGAFVLLGPRGEVEQIDERAERILRRYFPRETGADGLPAELRDWALGGRSAATVQSFADEQGRLLTARLLDSGGEPRWRAVVLDEWRPTPSPAELRVLGLTGREAEVLAWVARGRTDAQIGQLLTISPRTVDKHLQNIFRKLDVVSRAAAVARALSRDPG